MTLERLLGVGVEQLLRDGLVLHGNDGRRVTWDWILGREEVQLFLDGLLLHGDDGRLALEWVLERGKLRLVLDGLPLHGRELRLGLGLVLDGAKLGMVVGALLLRMGKPLLRLEGTPGGRDLWQGDLGEGHPWWLQLVLGPGVGRVEGEVDQCGLLPGRLDGGVQTLKAGVDAKIGHLTSRKRIC